MTRSPCSFTKKEPERAAVLFLETKGTAALSSLICFPVLETKTPSPGSLLVAVPEQSQGPPLPFQFHLSPSPQTHGSRFSQRVFPSSAVEQPTAAATTQQRPQTGSPWSCHRPPETEEEETKKKTCRDAADMKRRRGRSRSENSERKINCCCVCGCFCRLPPSRKVKRGGSYNRAPVG